jgi:TatD DNase family protein
MPSFIDSHCHLNMLAKKGFRPLDVLSHIFESGFSFCLDIVVEGEGFNKSLDMTERFDFLYLAAGFSPFYVTKKGWRNDLDALKYLLQNKRAVALGEIGLDYFRDYGTRKQQLDLMEAQLALAGELKKPVVIHCREAEKDLYEVLSGQDASYGGILHCFSSDAAFARKMLDLGYYISFAGNITYKKAENIRQAAEIVPPDRLLLETDAPYLSPQPVRGRVNRPEYVVHTYDFMARLKGMDLEDLKGNVEENFKRLFRL